MEDSKMLPDPDTSALSKFPPQLAQEFEKAWDIMSASKDLTQLEAWADFGMSLANKTSRSWETAVRYFGASPKIAHMMPHSYFLKWSECGLNLCEQSPQLASSYFEASPYVMARLRSRHIEGWANLGQRLYKGTWKSGALSSKYFEISPGLIANLSMSEMEKFVRFLELLALRSNDVAIECLVLANTVFSLVGSDKEIILSLASNLIETNWKQVKAFFEVASEALPRLEQCQRTHFVTLISELQNAAGTMNVPTTMIELSDAMGRVGKGLQGPVLSLSEQLLEVSWDAAPEFIQTAPKVLEKLDLNQMTRWHAEGLRVLGENKDAGVAYFKTESLQSQHILESLSSSIDFDRVRDLVEMYCHALAGSEVQIAPSEELVDKNIGWMSIESPSTEGSTVYLPSHIDKYNSKADNFGWLKVVSTHQVGHMEYGSFEFEFERPSSLFSNLRLKLENQQVKPTPSHDDTHTPKKGDHYDTESVLVTDMQRFFRLFKDRPLALDIFSVVEDGRLDSKIKSDYLGLRGRYTTVQSEAIKERPDMKSLPAREALIEFLVRVSLQQDTTITVPSSHTEKAKSIAQIAKMVQQNEALVEDAAEATIRIYSIIFGVSNEDVDQAEWEDLDVGSESANYPPATEDDDVLRNLTEGSGIEQPKNGYGVDEQEYRSTQNIDYRGDFKPELAQLLSTLRNQGDPNKIDQVGGEITQEMVEEFLKESLESEQLQADGSKLTTIQFANNVIKEAGSNTDQNTTFGQVTNSHVEEDGDALDLSEPQSFVYDEWDFRADDYKPRWCVVKQKEMAEGDPAYYGSTLHNYGALVAQIRKQFELMAPETFRKVRKLEDGEEIDIDDAIEALVDIRTGIAPSEKIYWRRNKVQRDVAVIFLLDTSASTAEAIEESRKSGEEWEAPQDPVEYIAWLRGRRGESARRSYKRIIDLEKEAVVLLINALETIGDVYGIYAFSGYGRENVEFYTIKDIDEVFSDTVKKRIDRVTPMHATRMGPAIRHATTKLESQDAKTKLLFLISDGRPQDRGYSREGVEKEYAVHDTKRALDEARDKDITAFCLTVDKNGHDYLKTMCEDVGYEVLDDINALPKRLLYLYRRLTT